MLGLFSVRRKNTIYFKFLKLPVALKQLDLSDKYDQDILRIAISKFRYNKTSLNSSAKECAVRRRTLQ
jgi:hypothetical protein